MPKFRQGVAVIRKIYTTPEDYQSLYAGSLYADATDYEAFKWLKDNTDKNCIFAIDSFTNSLGGDAHMMAGMFSERFVWNEEKYIPDANEGARRNLIVQSLQTDADTAAEQMKSEGVEYFVSQVSTDKTEPGALTDKLTEVFRNEHYIIYKL